MAIAVSKRRPSFWSLCPEEPYRIFFPLALFVGISGVSLWPLFFSGMHTSFYPGLMHARLMIEGFMGGFVIGFLGTAMPRLLSAPPLRAWELTVLIALHLTAAGLHIGHQLFAGDLTFAILLITFLVFLARRARQAVELPPPGFVFVGLGYLAGLLGTLLWLAAMRGWVGATLTLLGPLWLNQAFLLLLVLGVGSFLLPRFLGIPGLKPMDEERTASPEWRKRAGISLFLGLIFLGSYWLEAAHGALMAAATVRAAVLFVYLLAVVPIFRTPEPGRTVPLAVNTALAGLIAGLLFPLMWPGQRIAGVHIVFIAGFTLITLTVATRVVLGHSGNAHLFRTRLPSLLIVLVLLVVGTVLRVVGDFVPSRPAHLNWASYLWMLAAVIWAWAILPKVRESGDDPAHSARPGGGR